MSKTKKWTPEEVSECLRENLRAAMEVDGRPNSEIAEAMGAANWSRPSEFVRKMLAGERATGAQSPTLVMIAHACTAFGCSPQDLFRPLEQAAK